MIELDTFKKSLGEKGQLLTEQQVIKLRDDEYTLGHIMFDLLVLQGKQKIVSSTTIVMHKENGNARVCIFYSRSYYFYAY